MKKVLVLVTTVLFLIATLLTASLYSDCQLDAIINPQGSQEVYISDPSQSHTPEECIQAIEDAAQRSNVNLQRVYYSPVEEGQKQRITVYTYYTDAEAFYQNLSIKGDTLFADSSNSEQYISSERSADPDQVGKLQLFGQNVVLEIRPMEDMTSKSISAEYLLSNCSTEQQEQFKNTLEQDYFLTCSAPQSVSLNSPLFIEHFGLIACLAGVFILTLLSFLYFSFTKYKQFAIEKMFGMSNLKIIYRTLQTEVLQTFSIATLVSIGVSLIILAFYNHFARFFVFLFYLLAFFVCLALVLLFCFFIILQVARLAKSSQVVKNKKPMRSIKVTNFLVKLAFSMLAVMLFANACGQISTLQQQSNYRSWDSTRDYAVIGFTESDEALMNYDEERIIDKKMKEFYDLCDQNGAILAAPGQSSYIQCLTDDPTYYMPTPGNNLSYADPNAWPPKYDMLINSNYLANNQIYDTNGNRILVENDGSADLTILVPEKYRQYDAQMQQAFTETYTRAYYSEQDYDKYAQDLDLGYDYTDPEGALHYYGPLNVSIIYTANGQNYFTYDPNICKENNNCLTDPIAVVMNYGNMSSGDATAYISQGKFYPKVSDYNNPKDSLAAFIAQAGVQDNILSVTSLYDRIDSYQYQVRKQVAILFTIILSSIAIVVLVILFGAWIYLEENKQIITIRRMHGFSFIKRNASYLLSEGMFWIIVFGLLLIVLSASFDWRLLLMGTLCLMLLELLMSFPLLRFYENKKQQDILKGE